VIAAIREIDHWYFLRWSSYGNVVAIKAALVLLAAGVAALGRPAGLSAANPGARLAAGGSRASRAVTVLGVLVLAVTLTAMVPGRGQLLPAPARQPPPRSGPCHRGGAGGGRSG